MGLKDLAGLEGTFKDPETPVTVLSGSLLVYSPIAHGICAPRSGTYPNEGAKYILRCFVRFRATVLA
jgi:hypothetical protein